MTLPAKILVMPPVAWAARYSERAGNMVDKEIHLMVRSTSGLQWSLFLFPIPQDVGTSSKSAVHFFCYVDLSRCRDGSAKIQHLVLLGSFSLVATWPVEKSQVILFKLQTSSARGMCKLIHKHPQLLALHIYIYMYYVCMIYYDIVWLCM
jgi:hypothetical protein